MTTIAMNDSQQSRLQVRPRPTKTRVDPKLTCQSEVQSELERREWAEPGGTYLTTYTIDEAYNGRQCHGRIRNRAHSEREQPRCVLF